MQMKKSIESIKAHLMLVRILVLITCTLFTGFAIANSSTNQNNLPPRFTELVAALKAYAGEGAKPVKFEADGNDLIVQYQFPSEEQLEAFIINAAHISGMKVRQKTLLKQKSHLPVKSIFRLVGEKTTNKQSGKIQNIEQDNDSKKIYKWKDANGKTHFGDRPVNNKAKEVLNIDPVVPQWSKYKIQIEAPGVPLTKKMRQDIVDGVNHVYEFYDRVLFFDMYQTVPVNILLLKDKAAYKAYLKQKKIDFRMPTLGAYLPVENQIVMFPQRYWQWTLSTIKHEVSHAIADTLLPFTPSWLNEGIAEQMETLYKQGDKLYIKPHKLNRSGVQKALSRNLLKSIEAFLKLPSDKWSHAQTSRSTQIRAQAGQFVFFLLSKPTNRQFIVRLMHNFDRGNRSISYYLVDENYLGGMPVLKMNWKRWLKKQSDETIEL